MEISQHTDYPVSHIFAQVLNPVTRVSSLVVSASVAACSHAKGSCQDWSG